MWKTDSSLTYTFSLFLFLPVFLFSHSRTYDRAHARMRADDCGTSLRCSFTPVFCPPPPFSLSLSLLSASPVFTRWTSHFADLPESCSETDRVSENVVACLASRPQLPNSGGGGGDGGEGWRNRDRQRCRQKERQKNRKREPRTRLGVNLIFYSAARSWCASSLA